MFVEYFVCEFSVDDVSRVYPKFRALEVCPDFTYSTDHSGRVNEIGIHSDLEYVLFLTGALAFVASQEDSSSLLVIVTS